MTSIRKILFFLVVSLSLVVAQEDPVAFINEAIDKLEKNWEKHDTVDWQDIRIRYSEHAQSVKTLEETYPIIRDLLRELGDSWNYLSVPGESYEVPRDQTGFRVMLPDWVLVYVFDESPAALAGMKVGDQIIAVNGKPVNYRYAWDAPRVPTGGGAIYDSCKFEATHYCDLLHEIYAPGSRLQIRRAGEEESIFMEVEGQVEWNLMFPVGKRFGDIGYIELPPLKIEEQEYKNIVQQAIQAMEQSPTCGWIVDLRRHAGGEGPFVESVESLIKVNSDDQPSNSQAAVAILLSPMTASMGEYTADIIDAYAYNSNTFGGETWGNHPIVVPFRLSNKASLGLTKESGSLTPDVEVKNNWRYFQSEDDPVIQAASEWLMQQPSCSSE